MKRMAVFLLCASCGSTSELSSPSADSGTTASDTAAPVCTVDVSGIAIASDDPYAYPLYALDGCTLAYIGTDAALHVKDLATGEDEVVDSESPRRPSLAGDTLAWESRVSGTTKVRVRFGGMVVTLDGIAGEPRAAHDAVAFTRWTTTDLNGDTDVMLYVPSKGTTTLVAGGPGQQRFADASDTFIAVSDFSEDPDQRFDGDDKDLADIGLFDRATGTLTVRKKPGKQAFPILAGGATLVDHDWASIHPQPKLEAYDLYRTAVDAPVTADTMLASVHTYPPYTRPAGRGGVVEWVVRDDMGVHLWRATSSGAPAMVSSITDATDLFAPATGVDRTLIGLRDKTGKSALEIVPR
ncbi:MAG: hypothetical protein ACXVCJ_26255 [Polyangiales bacterium]